MIATCTALDEIPIDQESATEHELINTMYHIRIYTSFLLL